MIIDPRLDLGGVEADELADLHVRDSPLRDQTPDEPDCRPKSGRDLGNVEQPDRGRGGVGLCDLAWTCSSSHIHQRRVQPRKRVRKLSDLANILIVQSG